MNYFSIALGTIFISFIFYAAWQHQVWKRQAQANANLRREMRRQPDTLQRDITRICNREAR